jgi:hypothetical protein
MKKQILSEELLRMKRLAGILSESQYTQKLNEAVEIPAWLKGKLEDVHIKPGQGSIFSQSIDNVLKLAQGALDKATNIDQIANSTGTLTISSPGIGYNLVLPMDKAKNLPGATQGEVEKIEGPSKIKVPSITTTAPLSQFKSDQLTVIVRPKKDESGAVIPNEYIVLSAFPGDPTIPRTSEWGGKYAVIIPDGSENVQENKGMLHEVMDNITDANTAAEWIYGQLEEYIDNSLDGYGMGYHVEDKLEKLLGVISKKFNIPAGSFKIEDKYDTSYNEYDEGTIDGTVSLNGVQVVDYSAHSDGYGFRGEIDKNALKAELAKFIKPISESLLSEESTSQNYLDLIDINKFSQEFAISADTLKSIIDEMQADRTESDEKLKAERGTGFAPMSADSARESLIKKLVIKNILINGGSIDAKALMQRGIKPGPELGKLIKDYSDLKLKFMTPEKYKETVDNFLKEKGY